MPSGKSTRKTPSLPYIRRPSRAGLEEASPLAPGSPLTPGPSGRLEPAPTPGQGELLQHAVLPVADLNLEELQADLRDISTAAIQTASGQESDNTEESGSSSLDEVELEDEDDFRYDEEEVSESEHPEVSDLEGSPEDAATEVTPESSQQAGYQGTMAAALRTKLDSLSNDITVKITTVRNFLTKDPATNSSKTSGYSPPGSPPQSGQGAQGDSRHLHGQAGPGEQRGRADSPQRIHGKPRGLHR